MSSSTSQAVRAAVSLGSVTVLTLSGLVGGHAVAGPTAPSQVHATVAGKDKTKPQKNKNKSKDRADRKDNKRNKKDTPGKKRGQRAAALSVSGVITDRRGATLEVVVHSGRFGTRTLSGRSVDLTVTGRTARKAATTMRRATVGHALTLRGQARAVGRDLQVVAIEDVSETPTIPEAWFGLVRSFDAGTQTARVVLMNRPLNYDGWRSGPNGRMGGSVVVNVTSAQVTVDGGSGTPAPGDVALVLGQAVDRTIAATQVTIWRDTDPVAYEEDVEDINGTVVELGDDYGAPLNIDLAGVPVIRNGVMGTVADMRAGDGLLLVGTEEADGSFTPVLGAAFNDDADDPLPYEDEDEDEDEDGDGDQDDDSDEDH